MNTLYLGDNLPILQSIASESVDLIYIDPPFNSNRNYSGIIKGKNTSVLSDTSLKGGIGHNTAPFKGLRDSGGVSNSLILAQFEDTWRGGMKTYIHEFMFPIVKELHRILKPTGSFYLHCDPTAQAYLQVEVLDPIFGISNLRREIIWWRDNPSGGKAGANNYIHDHDIVFYYCKSQNFVFNRPFEDYSQEYIDQRFKFNDGDGKGLYRKQGVGLKIRKQYLSESKGKPLSSVWELSDINVMAKERTGYPTQKPEKLLERIILASSNEGDVVLDCFMGSGTTLVVADKLKRNFIGIDQSPVALAVTKSRLALNQDLFTSSSFSVVTKKWDYDKLRKMDDFEFEKLMVAKLGGRMLKQGKSADGGIDGIVNSKTVIQVKRSEGVSVNVLKNLKSTIEEWRWDEKNLAGAKESCVVKIQKGDVDLAEYDGVIVAFSFAKTIYASSVDYKIKSGFNFLILTVEDILPVARPPKVEIMVVDGQTGAGNTPKTQGFDPLKGVIGEDVAQNSPLERSLQAWEARPEGWQPTADGVFPKPTGYYTFTAQTQTTSKIENYSWLIKDKKTGEIVESESLTTENNLNKTLKKGEYLVSCEVVDEDGLGGNGEVLVVAG